MIKRLLQLNIVFMVVIISSSLLSVAKAEWSYSLVENPNNDPQIQVINEIMVEELNALDARRQEVETLQQQAINRVDEEYPPQADLSVENTIARNKLLTTIYEQSAARFATINEDQRNVENSYQTEINYLSQSGVQIGQMLTNNDPNETYTLEEATQISREIADGPPPSRGEGSSDAARNASQTDQYYRNQADQRAAEQGYGEGSIDAAQSATQTERYSQQQADQRAAEQGYGEGSSDAARNASQTDQYYRNQAANRTPGVGEGSSDAARNSSGAYGRGYTMEEVYGDSRRPARLDGGGTDATQTLGAMIKRFTENIQNIPYLLSIIAWFLAALFTALGLYKIRGHVVEGPQSVPLAEPIKFLVTGGMMASIPSIAGVLQAGLGGAGDGQEINNLGWETAGAPTDGLDNMLLHFMQDIYEPMQLIISVFCYIAGAAFTLVAIHRFTKSAQDGPKGPSGAGTIATFILAGVLFSIAPSIGTFTESLFGGRYSMLSVDFMALDQSMGAGSDHARNVIVSILAFLVVVGILSVIRGFFVLRGVAEGDQQSTMMGGLSHVIAGAILVNFGQFANIIQNTLGISGFGVLFN